jgi:hypothetical protein
MSTHKSTPSNTHNVNQAKNSKKTAMHEIKENALQDGMMFESLLQMNNSQNSIISQVLQQQDQGNQEAGNEQDQNKDENKQEKVEALITDGINLNAANEIASKDKAQIAEFSRALQDNFQKHFFEVTMPKLGKFNISTELNGNNLNFKVDAKEKISREWVKNHQSNIEQNLSAELKLETRLELV